MGEEISVKLIEEVRKSIPKYGTHGYDHIERVYKMCLHIGQVEKADMRILLSAALLHDISRLEENHAKAGAEKAKLILKRSEYTPDEIRKITNDIMTHSYSGKKLPETLEGKILSDSDKLDALGALGVYRTALYSGEHARPIDDFIAHFKEKLFKLEDLLFTNEAKKIARNRTEYMRRFFKRFNRELRQEI